jgi:L-lactate dehydrogenase complex protein LldG
MSSRDSILAKVRSHQPSPTPLPDLQGDWIRYADPLQQFREVLAGVGGQCHTIENLQALPALIESLPFGEEMQQIVNQVPGVNLGNLDLNSVADPHALADVDLAIMPGQFAVAENAAIWVDDRSVKHRVIYFLTQHLVLVVPQHEIVHNMHEAYSRLSFAERGYGLFISGPSKTADIEQSLVIGAHGPRSLHVVLVANG